ncbi:MAG: hypothetical protein QW279_16125 [Candidatus Jordarchaeaceae archaeon]
MNKPVENTKSSNISELEKECVIEGEFDNRVAISLAKAAIIEIAKLYGPIFTRMAAEYALEFESRKLKEKPPENIQGLEEVTNYIMANLDRYPTGQCPLVYGLNKAESKLQGFSSSGARRGAHKAMKIMFENTGLLNRLVGTTESAYDALKMLPVKEMKQVTRYHYIRGEEKNEVTAIYSNCPAKDACKALLDEGVAKMLGGLHCILLNCGAATVEIITRKTFDYVLEEFDTPDCKGRIFEV